MERLNLEPPQISQREAHQDEFIEELLTTRDELIYEREIAWFDEFNEIIYSQVDSITNYRALDDFIAYANREYEKNRHEIYLSTFDEWQQWAKTKMIIKFIEVNNDATLEPLQRKEYVYYLIGEGVKNGIWSRADMLDLQREEDLIIKEITDQE